MAYIYLMRESNLPEAVVKLICEFTGTREQWMKKKKQILNGQIMKLDRLLYSTKTPVKQLTDESNYYYYSYDVKEHINTSIDNLKNLRGIYREQELFYRATFFYMLARFSPSEAEDVRYGDDIRRLIDLSYKRTEENKQQNNKKTNSPQPANDFNFFLIAR